MRTVRPSPGEGQEIDPPSRRCIIHSGASTPCRPSGRRPSSRDNPSLCLADTALVEQTPFLRAALRRRGVRLADLDDRVQEMVFGAWLRMKTGGFRPSPDMPPGDALRARLSGVALRQASHDRDRASRRREVAAIDPDALAHFAAPSPERRVAARGLLRAFDDLRPELRDVLGRAALGLEMHEIARELGLPQGTVATRLRLARHLFARAVTRRRRGSR
jgi:DNA-directed RNA polymerase specialized sigma24 family protein